MNLVSLLLRLERTGQLEPGEAHGIWHSVAIALGTKRWLKAKEAAEERLKPFEYPEDK